MDLIFASTNKGKMQEVKALLSPLFTLTDLQAEGILEDIPEPFFSFKENAYAKAEYVFRRRCKSCFAEDSGLVVPALNDEPGVLSARYAGVPSDDQANNEKLLRNLLDIDDKAAYYQSVICLILNETDSHYFEGRCYGKITMSPAGRGGFGYDPLFIPDGYSKTFAEFNLEDKNKISHRGKAVKKLTTFLNELIIDR